MSSIKAFLINTVQDIVDLLRIESRLLLVLVGQFLLRAAALEGGVVRHECEVQSVVA
jgi:hypothetical protein